MNKYKQPKPLDQPLQAGRWSGVQQARRGRGRDGDEEDKLWRSKVTHQQTSGALLLSMFCKSRTLYVKMENDLGFFQCPHPRHETIFWSWVKDILQRIKEGIFDQGSIRENREEEVSAFKARFVEGPCWKRGHSSNHQLMLLETTWFVGIQFHCAALISLSKAWVLDWWEKGIEGRKVMWLQLILSCEKQTCVSRSRVV